jgi:prepilin-type processing-associated H-X9-DG protein
MSVGSWSSSSVYFGSNHVGGANFAMADGSVSFVSQTINLATFQTRGVRNDGAPVAGDPSASD